MRASLVRLTTAVCLSQSAATPLRFPVFRSGSTVVRVDVSVQDKKGHPVTDLTATSLVLFPGENGADETPAVDPSRQLAKLAGLRDHAVLAAPHRVGEDVIRAPANTIDPQLRPINRARLVLYTLKSLVNSTTGPMNVALISQGFFLYSSDANASLFDDLRATINGLNGGGVTVFAIDPRGLQGFNLGLAGQSSAAGPRMQSGVDDSGLEGLRSLSTETGGQFLGNRNNLAGALDVIATDRAAVYVIGYDVSDAPPTPGFHQITVRVGRHGVTVRTRTGYQVR